MTKERHFKSIGINQYRKKVKENERPITKYLSFLGKNRTNGDEKIILNLPSLAKGINLQKKNQYQSR